MGRYRSEEPSHLAQLLGRRTKDDPERFAKLALRFTNDIHAEAMNQLAEEELRRQ